MGRISLYPGRKQQSNNDAKISTKSVLDLECKKLKLECKHLKRKNKLLKIKSEKIKLEKENLILQKEKLQNDLSCMYVKSNSSSNVVYATASGSDLDVSQLVDFQNIATVPQNIIEC